MEEKIKRAASRVKMSFVYFWLLPVFLVIFGETGGAWVGLYAGVLSGFNDQNFHRLSPYQKFLSAQFSA